MSVMTGHPDWDNTVTNRSAFLAAMTSGNYPAAGTVLFQGSVTSWASIQLRCFPSAGGVQIHFQWYTDATQLVPAGSDDFMAVAGSGQYFMYEVQAPYLKITIQHVTTSPAGAGSLFISLNRSVANGLRPLVTPQKIALNGTSIPAGTTSTFFLNFATLGSLLWVVTSVAPASSITATLEEIDWNSVTLITHFGPAVIIAGASVNHLLTGNPVRLKLQNTTTAPATVITTLISQQQGW